MIRKILAGAAVTAVGLLTVGALAAPAQANGGLWGSTALPTTPPSNVSSSVEFIDDCDGTEVTVISGTYLPSYTWEVSYGGDATSETKTVDKSESFTFDKIGADAGKITVRFQTIPNGWPKTHTWIEPDGCEPTPSPTPSQSPTPEPIQVVENDCDAYLGAEDWCDSQVEDYNCENVPEEFWPVVLKDQDVDPFGLDGPIGPATDGEPGIGCEVEEDQEPVPSTGGEDKGSGGLPVTGTGTAGIAAVGGGALALGGSLAVLSWAWKRRRDNGLRELMTAAEE